ncbi:ABC transporter ATP-binding protein/permease [Metabacillus sp. GX 13764]|uniref:ABC transporter ATP-binding protein n=1 Tax=Metabacillus kandeliae TaxID=2900151 RepID=UPI001E5800A2|nr:ABC transporter ATP-binding protein [Metabacillus kandeliae]MCD7034000.1 ABC transporter ATP-binding protein/permease [Metabacillus kandeliae]
MRPSFRGGRAGEQKEKQRASDWTGTLARIWRYLAESKGMLTVVLLMVLFSSALGLLGPFLIGYVIDRHIVPKETNGLTGQLLLLAAVYFLFSLTTWLQNIWMVSIAQKTVYKMRTQLFQQFHRLSIPFFDKRQHGELMSRVTNDIDNVSQTLNSSAIQIFSSVLTLIGTVAVMLWLSPLLTLLTMMIIPIMFFGMRWITNRTGRMFKKQQKNLGELNGFIEETISGQKIIKTFSQEDRVIKRFQEKNEQLREAGYWAQTFSGFIPKLMNVLNNLSFAVIAGVGGYLALHGFISIGTIVVFTEYSRQFTRPLNDLSNQFNTLLSAVAGAERVFEILDMEEEAADEKNAGDVQSVKGEVQFQHVSFSYEDTLTLHDISFKVQPGETVAFVGATGAGKTTITNLLSRFYDAQEGSILIDGREIQTIRRESLRSHMGFVLQDSFLFQGTIRENIRYGRLDAADEEVEQAAVLANASSFIEKLPDQYDTLLKQDGGGISQGQKQLLSIARAILSKPSILILDEATSSIDTITEMNIQEALQRLMEGRTSFVIAHRLNTIQNADHILVLENGEIAESGTHDTLLSKKGHYYSLYNSQLEEFSS